MPDLEEFFATGRGDVDEVLRMLADRGVAIEMGRALDFECGVGRLTGALAEHFDSCDGVDSAAEMIERARELNQNGERVRFHHSATPDLHLFGDGSFDFVLALLVLHHMDPHLMVGYLREFLRVLRPGGVAFFNIPAGLSLEPGAIDQGGKSSRPQMETHVMSQGDVVRAVEGAGGVVLDVISKDRGDPSLRNFDYVVARAVAPAPAASGGERRNPPGFIEARIHGALEGSKHGSRAEEHLAADGGGPERRRLALDLLDERADLVGFALTSTLKGVGRASTAVRGALRRALLEVLHRQTEHNRASDQLIRSHEAQLEALGATVRAQLDIQAATDERLDAVERRLAPIEVNSVTLARRAARRRAVQSGAMDLDYMAFSERFHGTRGDIRERLRRYVPRFKGLSDVVDAGCGRGEFLELLRDAGTSAVGVDADEGMVRRCRELGLEAVRDDAVHFLRVRQEESSGGIFAAHLVEHLERRDVVELVRLAFSRLRPAGALVIETVNPMCLLTYASFYADFTRVEPVPPLALKWLAESSGFAEVEIEYSSPVPPEEKLRLLRTSAGEEAEVDAFNRGLAAANEVLFGFREYALVARKPG